MTILIDVRGRKVLPSQNKANRPKRKEATMPQRNDAVASKESKVKGGRPGRKASDATVGMRHRLLGVLSSQPGSNWSLTELCAEFDGVSRVSIRAALKALEADGSVLVKQRVRTSDDTGVGAPGKGWFTTNA